MIESFMLAIVVILGLITIGIFVIADEIRHLNITLQKTRVRNETAK